ncbi:MAG: glycogen synthase GlgA [Roseiflexaceae bacterium]
MNVLFVASEVTPLIKTGGLADVAGALPPALRRLGHDVRIVMPRYQRIRQSKTPQAGPITGAFLPVGERQEEMRVVTTQLGDTPIYMLDIPAAFERPTTYGDPDDDRRFILFARGIMALMIHLRESTGWQPHVVHCNDWHAGLVANYLKTYYSYTFGHIATVYTIHNLAYQGVFNSFTLHLSGLAQDGFVEGRAGPAFQNQFNFMARGLIYSDLINTVSPTYAEEILTPEYGEGLDGLLRERRNRLSGILNGIDYSFFNPEIDSHITMNYSADDMRGKPICKAALQKECGFPEEAERPLLGMVTRLAEQKGLDLLDGVMPWLLAETDAQLVLLGSGQPYIEQAFANYMRAYPQRVNVQLRFDAALAQRIYAGCDAFLMPSRYEPGGLGQLIALRYGTVPVVRATGGLNDTVREGWDGNGFRFHPYEARYLQDAMARCLAAFRDTAGWDTLRRRGMREDHSWDASARVYVDLYERARDLLRG